MDTIHTTMRGPGAIGTAFILVLGLLLPTTMGWSSEKQRPRAAALTDQVVIQQVREFLKEDATFVGNLVTILSSDGQRTLLIPFKGSRGLSRDVQTVEAAMDLLMGFLAGGRAALAAEKPIHTVTVLVLGGAQNLAFRASVLSIGLLVAGFKTPETFFQDDLIMVDLDKGRGAK